MDRKNKRLLCKILISLILFVIGILIGNKKMGFQIYLISYLIVGLDILKKAFARILKRKFLDENFLMAVAGIGAFIIGEYTEAVAVMIFYQTGELFQSYSVNKSRRSISELMSLCPDYAYVERGEKIVKILPDEIVKGEILVVKPGEKIPVDGIIISGKTSFNTAPLTGESLPKNAEEGDFVSSGFINLEGVVRIRAEKEYADSTVMKILELVENSTMAKAKTERFITRFSVYYTPIVVILAVLLAFIPPIFAGDFSVWVYRALSFLVVSCPCALVISVPLSFFGGIGGASKKGILIKGANFLETLSKCKTFVFDKTGTLTKGIFEVVSVVPSEISEEEFAKFLSVAENGSNHPVAKAIIKKFGESKIQGEITEISGRGIKAFADGREILAGNLKLMEENKINAFCGEQAGTTVHLAVDGKYAGYVCVSDTVKDEAKEAISELYGEGVLKTVMLSGDTKENAQKTAGCLSLSDYKAELMPKDKVDEVKKLKKNGESVAFTGDGINDAPVLALSDVGIAMGGIGSDASIEAADIVLMDDNLLKLPLAVKIAKKTMRIVKENIVFAIGIKCLVLVLSAWGITNMWAAVFADVGVAVLAILNAMRAMKV